MTRAPAWLKDMSPPWAVTLGMAMLVVVGLLDYLTGSDVSFSIFFLGPVIFVTWQLGRMAGIGTCLLASFVWFMAEQSGSRVYSHGLIPYWNALVRLGFFIIVALLISRLKDNEDEQRRLARTDPLTGIANARRFHELCGLELERSRRHARPLTIAFMDIDRFKHVNDSMGHSAGDELLCSVARLLSGQLRSIDQVARMGGDEFVILLPETMQDEARETLSRLQFLLAENAQSNGWPVGFSIGVATFATAPESIDSMLGQADALMYQAKSSDSETICFTSID